MLSRDISETSVLEKFDRLVAQGTVLYSPDLRKIYHEDGGFKFEFRLTSALKSKPRAVWGNSELDAERSSSRSSSADQRQQNGTSQGDLALRLDADGCIPGGDISVAGFVVVDESINGTHVLMFNKFCAYRPHLLLLAADGHRRQFEALGREDFEAARGVLGALGRGGGAAAAAEGSGSGENGKKKEEEQEEYLMIFNCGKDGGCSRLHKHMQIFPTPGDFPLWPDSVGTASSTGDEKDAAAVGAMAPPFHYFMHRFADDDEAGVGRHALPASDELARTYQRMLVEATRVHPGRDGVVEDDGGGHRVAVPHNVVLSRRWMVVIPRTKAGVDGADANAAGMLGMVWAAGEETFEKWRGMGPRWILGEVGVRK